MLNAVLCVESKFRHNHDFPDIANFVRKVTRIPVDERPQKTSFVCQHGFDRRVLNCLLFVMLSGMLVTFF